MLAVKGRFGFLHKRTSPFWPFCDRKRTLGGRGVVKRPKRSRRPKMDLKLILFRSKAFAEMEYLRPTPRERNASGASPGVNVINKF